MFRPTDKALSMANVWEALQQHGLTPAEIYNLMQSILYWTFKDTHPEEIEDMLQFSSQVMKAKQQDVNISLTGYIKI